MDYNQRNSNRDSESEVSEKLLKLNRVAKVVKGGRRFSFSALVVVGNNNGKVGFGLGKANDVSEAIRKASDKAKRDMISIPMKNGTIPHHVLGKFKSASILLKPAAPGTGIIAGGAVRAILEASGLSDILSKSLGSKNAINATRATFNGLQNLLFVHQVAKDRDRSIKDLWE